MKNPRHHFGRTYHETRRAEPRLARDILATIGDLDVGTILDVGSGISDYAYFFATQGYRVLALEPSEAMRAQSQNYYPHRNITQIACTAEAMNNEDIQADVAICILSLHHFLDVQEALKNIKQVGMMKRVVFFSVDHRLCKFFWFSDYFPEIWSYAQYEMIAPMADQVAVIRRVFSVAPDSIDWPVPRNCQDLFFGARWESPSVYTDRSIFKNTTPLMRADKSIVDAGIAHLRDDIQSGAWDAKYSDMICRHSMDLGHRILVVDLLRTRYRT